METFERLEVWRKSKDLAVRICLELRGCRDYGLRDQIQRAAVSVPSNIAEGLERNGRAEYRNFLGIAKGSAGEVRTQLIILQELGYLDSATGKELLGESVRISKMLNSLIRSLGVVPRSAFPSSRLPPSTSRPASDRSVDGHGDELRLTR